MKIKVDEMPCPCNCENGISFNRTYGSEKTCTVCNGTGVLTLTRAKIQNLDYLFNEIK